MELVLASGNRGKVREFQEAFGSELKALDEVITPFHIEESADTFAGNAVIKAKAVYEKVGDNYIVISDDSGISVDALDGDPGIYSARYAGKGASDRDNLQKMINTLKSKGLNESKAHYTASVAIVSRYGVYVVHGWMYGKVIAEIRGDGGFGYDPAFIPDGFDKTLGELPSSVKSEFSHRTKAIELAKPIIDMLKSIKG